MTFFFSIFSSSPHCSSSRNTGKTIYGQFVGFRKRCYSGINVTFKNWSIRQWLMVGFHSVTLRVIFDKLSTLPYTPTHTITIKTTSKVIPV